MREANKSFEAKRLTLFFKFLSDMTQKYHWSEKNDSRFGILGTQQKVFSEIDELRQSRMFDIEPGDL